MYCSTDKQYLPRAERRLEVVSDMVLQRICSSLIVLLVTRVPLYAGVERYHWLAYGRHKFLTVDYIFDITEPVLNPTFQPLITILLFRPYFLV